MMERPVTSTAAPLGSIAGQPLILVPGRVRAENLVQVMRPGDIR